MNGGLSKLWAHRSLFGRRKAYFVVGMVLAATEAAAVIPIPLLVARAIDKALPASDTRTLTWYVAGILACAFASMAASIAATSIFVAITRDGIATLRRRCSDALIGASRQFHTDREETALHDLLVADAARIDEMANVVLSNVLPSVLTLLSMVVALVIVNPTLTLVTAMLLPLIAATHLAFRGVRHRAAITFHDAYERFSSGVYSTLRSDELIRMEAAHGDAIAAQTNRIIRLRDAGWRSILLNRAHDSTQLTTVSIVAAAILFVGGRLVISDDLLVGELVSFYAAFGLLRRPIAYLAAASGFVTSGALALHNVEQFLAAVDTEPYTGTRPVAEIRTIAMHDVTFGYPKRPAILNTFSMQLERGKVIGLAGPNGSGKSTVIHLLLGLYRPDAGGLTVNEVPFDDLDIRTLRSRIGVVPQHPVFLSGSIADNLKLYGTTEWSQRALALAGADAVVAALPDGINTQIGDDGIRLSGGQRQRLAIARALIRNPEVLILDEPTLHLDAHSIDRLVSLMRQERQLCVLIVSHQREVFEHVDHLIEFV